MRNYQLFPLSVSVKAGTSAVSKTPAKQKSTETPLSSVVKKENVPGVKAPGKQLFRNPKKTISSVLS